MTTCNDYRVSAAPSGELYAYSADDARERRRLDEFLAPHAAAGATIVAVQGIGFVGSAMAAALAEARGSSGAPRFAVIGVDLSDEGNYWKIARVRRGRPPVSTTDPSLADAYARAYACGNLTATFSPYAYERADVVVVDVQLDVGDGGPSTASDLGASQESYLRALDTVARSVRQNALVVIETTVPPGTTARVVHPLFAAAYAARGFNDRRLLLAHSYERVTPGPQYLESVTNVCRVFAGIDGRSARRAREFFEGFVNTAEFPLTELPSTTACELAKVLENSYRAVNIAFMDEWTRFAEAAGVDLFGVVDAIRRRPTHRNLMAPGFGVGGYCLPKDPQLADWAYRTHFGGQAPLRMSLDAVRVNDAMPLHALALLREAAGSLAGLHVALLGVSYRDGVADTRRSASAIFYDRCVEAGAHVTPHDPMVHHWPEMGLRVEQDLEAFEAAPIDAVVFAVRHPEYLALQADDLLRLFGGARVVIDGNNVVSNACAQRLRARGIRTVGIGKGHWRSQPVSGRRAPAAVHAP